MFVGVIQSFIVAVAKMLVPKNLGSTGIQMMENVIMCTRMQEVISKNLRDDESGSGRVRRQGSGVKVGMTGEKKRLSVT